MMEATLLAYYILIHLNLAVWGAFTVWYGGWRRWEASPHGVNTFVTSLSMTLLWSILLTGIYWRMADWRVAVVLVTSALILGAGVQRLWLLHNDHPDEESEP